MSDIKSIVQEALKEPVRQPIDGRSRVIVSVGGGGGGGVADFSFDIDDFTTISAVSLDVISSGTGPTNAQGITMNNDGTVVITNWFNEEQLYKYNMPAAYSNDLANMTSADTYLDITFGNAIRTMNILALDQSIMYAWSNKGLQKFTLNGDFDITAVTTNATRTQAEVSADVSAAGIDLATPMNALGAWVSEDEQYVTFADNDNTEERVLLCKLNTAGDIASGFESVEVLIVGSKEITPRCAQLNPAGDELLLLGNNGIHKYALSAAYKLSNATVAGSVAQALLGNFPTDFHYSPAASTGTIPKLWYTTTTGTFRVVTSGV